MALVKRVKRSARHPFKSARRLAGRAGRIAIQPVVLPTRALVGSFRLVPSVARGGYKYVLKPVGRAGAGVASGGLAVTKFAGTNVLMPVASAVAGDVHSAGRGVVTRLWDMTKTPTGAAAVGGMLAFAVPGAGTLLFSGLGVKLALGAGLGWGAKTGIQRGWYEIKARHAMAGMEQGTLRRINGKYYGVTFMETFNDKGARVKVPHLVEYNVRTGEMKTERFEKTKDDGGVEIILPSSFSSRAEREPNSLFGVPERKVAEERPGILDRFGKIFRRGGAE